MQTLNLKQESAEAETTDMYKVVFLLLVLFCQHLCRNILQLWSVLTFYLSNVWWKRLWFCRNTNLFDGSFQLNNQARCFKLEVCITQLMPIFVEDEISLTSFVRLDLMFMSYWHELCIHFWDKSSPNLDVSDKCLQHIFLLLEQWSLRIARLHFSHVHVACMLISLTNR